MTSKESESILKNLSVNNSPGLDGVSGEFYQHSKKVIPILLKLFQKTEEEGILPNSYYEVIITLIPKPDKGATQKKLQAW